MFEEMYKEFGTVRVPTEEYIDGQPQYQDHSVKLLTFEKGVRHPQTGALMCENTFLIKSDTLTDIPATSRIVNAKGETFDIATIIKIKDFSGKIECFKAIIK